MTIALYIRLSKEDSKNKESNSVKNQRNMLKDYVIKKFENADIIEFVDDGYTGTNFERPQFKNMIKSIKGGKINIVIVKDLSRLGRNYIEIMNYVEEVFPLYNTKLISINDNINSDSNYSTSLGLETSFKTIIHDFYSRDLSKKVKSALKSKALKGEYVQHEVFFGYKKSDIEKNKLVIDDEPSKVVRYIYEMAMQGLSVNQIAKTLNDKNIDTPMKYILKNVNPNKYFTNKNENVFWTKSNVGKILNDVRYTGTLVANRKHLTRVGGTRQKRTDEKDLIKVENAFEKIVTQEEFYLAQKIINRKPYKPKVKKNDIFTDKIICGKCNHNLIKHNYRGKVKYNCQFYKNTSYDLCFGGYIQRDDIENIIFDRIKKEIKLFIDLKKQSEEIRLKVVKEKEKLLKEKNNVIEEIKQLKIQKSNLIEQLVEEKIEITLFKEKNKKIEEQIKILESKKGLTLKKLNEINLKLSNDTNILEILESAISQKNLNTVFTEFVEKVIVYDKENIEIKFNFKINFKIKV